MTNVYRKNLQSKYVNKEMKSNSTFKLVILSIIVLFTVYSIHLKILPSVVSPRILLMFILSFIFFLRESKKTIKSFEWDKYNLLIWGVFNFVLLVYSFIITYGHGALNSEYNAFVPVFNYFFMVVIFSYVLESFIVNEDQFCKAIILATLLQSIIVILSLSNDVRTLLETIQYGDIDRYSQRVIGLGITGATGSIYLYTGLFANAYMILFKKKKLKYLISFIIIFIAITLVARTGFYVSVILLLFMIVMYGENFKGKIKNLIYTFLLIILFVTIGSLLMDTLEVNNDLIRYTLGRLDEILSLSDSKTIKTISGMNIPPLTIETAFGTGVRKGYINTGLLIWHDSGYVQRFMSIGFFMALFSYTSLVIYITNLIKRLTKFKKKQFFMMLLLIMLVLELKEPFIFTLAYPFVLLMLIRLTIKSETKKIITKEIEL